MMKQEIIAGIVFCVIGPCMLFLPSKTLWKITEKWKTKGTGQPSRKYTVMMRVLGVVFTAVGAGLVIWG